MLQDCADCVSVGGTHVQFAESKSDYCVEHIRARRQHASKHRSACNRARQRGLPEPERPTYEPQPVDTLTGRDHDRRISADDVDYLDNLIAAVRASKGDLDTAITTGTRLDSQRLVDLNRDLGMLLTELNRFLHPDGRPPPRRRRTLKPRYR